MPNYEKFEIRLRELGKTVSDLSRETGISPSTFSEWKTGKHSPNLKNLIEIAHKLNTSVDYFIRDTDKEGDNNEVLDEQKTARRGVGLFKK